MRNTIQTETHKMKTGWVNYHCFAFCSTDIRATVSQRKKYKLSLRRCWKNMMATTIKKMRCSYNKDQKTTYNCVETVYSDIYNLERVQCKTEQYM